MKNILATIALVMLTINSASAQEWQTDFTEAKKMAKAEARPIILVFQGSDWCAPCIKLDREVWSTEVFKKFARDNYVMLQADFPRKKKNTLSENQAAANAKLAENYNKSGIFPLVVILDQDGKVLGKTSYKKLAPEAYIEELNAMIR